MVAAYVYPRLVCISDQMTIVSYHRGGRDRVEVPQLLKIVLFPLGGVYGTGVRWRSLLDAGGGSCLCLSPSRIYFGPDDSHQLPQGMA